MIWAFILGGALLLLVLLLSFTRHRGAHISPEPAREPLPAKSTNKELPTHYGTDEVVALVKDPHWLHAYWEITAAKQQEVSRMYGPEAWEQSRPVLRVYDVTEVEDFNGTNAPYSDVEINEEASSWYLYVGKPNHSFYLDLGRRTPQGEFIPLARSNRVTLPSNSPSLEIDPLWPPLEHLQSGSLAWGRTSGTSPVAWGISSPQMPARESK